MKKKSEEQKEDIYLKNEVDEVENVAEEVPWYTEVPCRAVLSKFIYEKKESKKVCIVFDQVVVELLYATNLIYIKIQEWVQSHFVVPCKSWFCGFHFVKEVASPNRKVYFFNHSTA